MNNLIDFKELKKNLEEERQLISKVYYATPEERELVRKEYDASLILDFIENFQGILIKSFTLSPFLEFLFDREYSQRIKFFKRSTILELCFVEEYLFPALKIYPLTLQEKVESSLLSQHIISLESWISLKRERHHTNVELLNSKKFPITLKQKELHCQCNPCIATYRNKLRKEIFEQVKDFIDGTILKLEEKTLTFDQGTSLFLSMKNSINKLLSISKESLRKSSLNRLEDQIEKILKEIFPYPKERSQERSMHVKLFCKNVLKEEMISTEIILDSEYDKFLSQLSLKLWRSKEFILKDFKKILRSMLILKKKDVSSEILQSYLGEFWAHTEVRQIKRKIIYHMGPTNSGKTYYAIKRLCKAKRGCYLAPLRLLAAELYDTMNKEGVVTSLLTGEEVILQNDSTHTSSTIEMAKLHEVFDCCVIDEIQMITDLHRGWAWTRALINIFADEVHICGDPSVLNLIEEIVCLCGDELEIKTYSRMTELIVEDDPITLQKMKVSDALIVFSRRNALRSKRDLERLGHQVSIVYGRLAPEVRREQARKFDEGITDIIVSTDAISMGMNLPIKRIVFSTLSKFFMSKEHMISQGEITQIAGRAGRYQRFSTGYVTCLESVDNGNTLIKQAFSTPLKQQEKCIVGPDLEIYTKVNEALGKHGLTRLKLSEFLRLFNTMIFKEPFFCVDLREMIELAEIVEEADQREILSISEIFGFACAPVNQGLMEHMQHFLWILNHYISARPIVSQPIDHRSKNIDYLETAIKCVDLYRWLSRHFKKKHFQYDEAELMKNKSQAIDKLNDLLSQKNSLGDNFHSHYHQKTSQRGDLKKERRSQSYKRRRKKKTFSPA